MVQYMKTKSVRQHVSASLISIASICLPVCLSPCPPVHSTLLSEPLHPLFYLFTLPTTFSNRILTFLICREVSGQNILSISH